MTVPETRGSSGSAAESGAERHATGGVLSDLAETSVGIKSLLVTLPAYARRWMQIFASPVGFFRTWAPNSDRDFKQSTAFLLQALIVSFIVLTMGRALPQSIATFSAVNLPLISGAGAADLRDYVRRVEAVSQTLPAELASSWLRQGELMLAVRVLPEERVTVLLERLRAVAAERPALLARAIEGSLGGPERFGGRSYLLSFFGALNPQTGPVLYQTHQITYAGPRYELPPYVEFLLSTVLLWLLVCGIITVLVPATRSDRNRRTVFAIGALLWGFLCPLAQLLNTLLRFYLAATLPVYIPAASQLMSQPAPPRLVALSGGVFPYENLALVAVQVAASLALLGYAVAAFTVGLRGAFRIPRPRAIAVSAVAIGLGLGLTALVMQVVVLVLAPTGLL